MTELSRRNAMSVLVMIALALTAPLGGCGDRSGPPIAIQGGGFIFNYRVAEVFYGVSVKPLWRLDPGTVLVAEFEDPAGGPPLVVRETVVGGRLSYGLRTPPLQGVRAGRDYKVVVAALAPDGRKLGRVSHTLRSDLDQEVNPDRPLTVGPGYTQSPDAVAGTAYGKARTSP